MLVICTWANIAVWVLAVQTDSQRLDARMPTMMQHTTVELRKSA